MFPPGTRRRKLFSAKRRAFSARTGSNSYHQGGSGDWNFRARSAKVRRSSSLIIAASHSPIAFRPSIDAQADAAARSMPTLDRPPTLLNPVCRLSQHVDSQRTAFAPATLAPTTTERPRHQSAARPASPQAGGHRRFSAFTGSTVPTKSYQSTTDSVCSTGGVPSSRHPPRRRIADRSGRVAPALAERSLCFNATAAP